MAVAIAIAFFSAGAFCSSPATKATTGTFALQKFADTTSFVATILLLMAHPPRIPVWLGWEQEVIYFATFNVSGRRRVLANAPAFAAWKLTISRLTAWTVLAGVMMPDHIHVLTAPAERDADVGIFSGLTKRWIREQARHDWRWQKGSFDHLLRHDESAAQKWDYIRENPVRAGLVERWQDWPYRIGFENDL